MQQPFNPPASARSPSFDNIVILSVADAHQQYQQACIDANDNLDLLACLGGWPHPTWANVLAELARYQRTAQACLLYLDTDHRSRKPSLLAPLLGIIKPAWGSREWRLEGALLDAALKASVRLKGWLDAGASWEKMTIDEIILPDILLDSTYQPEEQEQ